MSILVTIIGTSTYKISSYTQEADKPYHGRLLNAPSIEAQARDSVISGDKLQQVVLEIANKDSWIDSIAEKMAGTWWGATVQITLTGLSETWIGAIDSSEQDVNSGVLTVQVYERTLDILSQDYPRKMLVVSEFDGVDAKYVNKVIPIPIGGTESDPIRIPGMVADHTGFTYVFSEGEIRSCVAVEKNGTVITEGFTVYLGTSGQAVFPGFVSVKFAADPRDDADRWPDVVISVVGLKFGSHTAEECRNPMRAFYWLLKTASSGVNGWGWGVDDSKINPTTMNQAIADCDTFGFKVDGLINEQFPASTWMTHLLNCCRGSRSIVANLWELYVDKIGSTVKTFDPDNSFPMKFNSGSAKEHINMVHVEYRYRHGQQSGSFVGFIDRPDNASIAAIGLHEETIKLPLCADYITAGKIGDYLLNKRKYCGIPLTINTLRSPGTAAKPNTVITANYTALGSAFTAALFRVVRPLVREDQILLECESYSNSIFDTTAPGAAPDDPVQSQNLPGTSHVLAPDAITSLSLATGHEIRQDGTVDAWINGTFTKGRNFISADIQVSDDGALTWMSRGSTPNNEFHLGALNPGHEYYVRVIAHGLTGQASPVTAPPITTDGPTGPADVTNFTVVRDELDFAKVKFSWDPNLSAHFRYFEIRKGSSWNTAAVIGYQIMGTKFEHNETDNGNYTYLIKGYDNSLNLSVNAAPATIDLKIYPADVANPKAYQNGEEILLTWDAFSDLDVVGVEIWEGSGFELGTKVADAITDISVSIKAGAEKVYNFWFKAKTSRKAYSKTATWAGLSVSNLMPRNYIVTQNEITNPTGSHNNTALTASAFRMRDMPARATDPMYQALRWNMTPGGAVLALAQASPGVYYSSGYYEFIIDIVQATTVTIDIDAFLFTLPPGVSAYIAFSYAVDPASYSNFETYTGAVSKTLRLIKTRVYLETTDTAKTPEITKLTIRLDVPDIDRRIRVDVQNTDTGTYVAFGYTYNLKPYIVLTAEGAYLGELTGYVTEDPLVPTQKFTGAMVRARIPNTTTYVTGVNVNGHIKGY